MKFECLNEGAVEFLFDADEKSLIGDVARTYIALDVERLDTKYIEKHIEVSGYLLDDVESIIAEYPPPEFVIRYRVIMKEVQVYALIEAIDFLVFPDDKMRAVN